MRIFGNYRFLGICLIAVGAVGLGGQSAEAQSSRVHRGFDSTLEATATGEELTAQTDLWVMEVSFKPMRMIWVDLTDAKTGKKSRELVWYLVYKAVNRTLHQRQDTSDTVPVNDNDPAPKQFFVPEFTLVTQDGGVQKIYADRILPEAQAVIIERERRDLKNSVQVVRAIPTPTPAGAESKNTIYGVVTWRNIDDETDFFTIYMTGFSSGKRLQRGPDGKPLALRRTIMQEYWRPGDELAQREGEIRRESPTKWMYRPDEAKDAPANSSAKKPADDKSITDAKTAAN